MNNKISHLRKKILPGQCIKKIQLMRPNLNNNKNQFFSSRMYCKNGSFLSLKNFFELYDNSLFYQIYSIKFFPYQICESEIINSLFELESVQESIICMDEWISQSKNFILK